MHVEEYSTCLLLTELKVRMQARKIQMPSGTFHGVRCTLLQRPALHMGHIPISHMVNMSGLLL